MRVVLPALFAGVFPAAWFCSSFGGCTLKLTGADGGTAGSGTTSGASTSMTVLDQCTSIYTELCTQGMQRCGILESLSDCLANDVPSCCTGSVCSESSLSSSSAVDACKAALDAEDCNSVANGVAPSACQGVPQLP